jgi:hypothetical protein
MPTQQLFSANPSPDPCLLPDDILKYAAKLDHKNFLPKQELEALDLFTRTANYISAGAFELYHLGSS